MNRTMVVLGSALLLWGCSGTKPPPKELTAAEWQEWVDGARTRVDTAFKQWEETNCLDGVCYKPAPEPGNEAAMWSRFYDLHDASIVAQQRARHALEAGDRDGYTRYQREADRYRQQMIQTLGQTY